MEPFYKTIRNSSLNSLNYFAYLTCFFFCTLFIVSKSSAQCDFDSPGVSLNTTTFDGANCQVNIDLSFDLESNNGNKFVFVHLWTLDGYASSHPIPYNSAPSSTQLGNALATLVIDNRNSTPVLLDEYRADAGVSPLVDGMTISKGEGLNTGFERFVITNLKLTIPGSCNSVPGLKGDAWSTNANSPSPTVHCSTLGFQLVSNDISLSGNLNCNDPASNSYDIDVTTTATTPFEISYKVYLDDGDGILEAGMADGEIEAGTAMISSLSPFSLSDVLYAHTETEKIRSLWVVVDGQAVPYFLVEELVSTCILPVKMTYFKATPMERVVNLNWETTEEVNSSYFEIERSKDGREFSVLGKVNAKGSSQGSVLYHFSDAAPVQGISYYRLKQVDLDGTINRSRIVSVTFDESLPLFELLGNPSAGDKIHFLFKNLDKQDLRLFDLAGKAIPFSLSAKGSECHLNPSHKLETGVYILAVKFKGASMSRKIIIP